MKQLNEIFTVKYGNKLDLNKMELASDTNKGVNFVSRTSQNNGVSAVVKRIDEIQPYKAESISVSLGGTKLLSSFVQLKDFYTAQNVAVLIPKTNLTLNEKIYYCLCITHNRFRYSAFGREANRTLRSLLVPSIDEIPTWVNQINTSHYDNAKKPFLNKPTLPLNTEEWDWFKLKELFDIQIGVGPKVKSKNISTGYTPFISTTRDNNGISYFCNEKPLHPANTISVSNDGSVAEAFFQNKPYVASYKVNILVPKFPMNKFAAIFLCTILRLEKYRYSYGRKWGIARMQNARIKLPVKENRPDFEYMEDYIERLPFSKEI